MSDNNAVATNGAAKEQKIKCVMASGEFLQLLLNDRVQQQRNQHPGLKAATIHNIEKMEETVNIKTEENQKDDVEFLNFIKRFPSYANMSLTTEQWKEVIAKNQKEEIEQGE